MIQGLSQLLVFWFLGECLHFLTQVPISGAVLGMLLLFAYLMISKRSSEGLEQTSQVLISQLSLLLLPGCAGLFFLGERMQGQWLPVLAAIFGGTLLSVVTTLWLMQKLVARTDAPAAVLVGTDSTNGADKTDNTGAKD